jgi:hypothetical protein
VFNPFGVTYIPPQPILATVDRRFNLFRRVWAASALALIAVTWTLWTPQHVFPQVPVHAQLGRLPDLIDWMALGGMVLGLVAVLLASRWQQGLVLFVVAAALLMAIDQHRFQPWAYQFTIIAVVLATAKPPVAFRLLRWLTIGIYAWSAWSKCDITFTHNLGQQFLNAIFGWANFEDWPSLSRVILASSFPAAEFTIAVLLCFPRLWSKAVWASVVLHLLLLVVLGPFGLHHKPGVLLWNVYFIVQNLLIFRVSPGTAPLCGVFGAKGDCPVQPSSRDKPLPEAVLYVVAAAIAWPLVEAWSYCDHWPAWSVYAPRVERTSFFVHRSEKGRLPPPIQPFLERATDEENWFLIRLDLWSLDSLDAPLYPQSRFQIGAAEGVARQFGLTQVRVVRHSSADRWTGRRQNTLFTGLQQIDSATKDYIVGTRMVRPLSFAVNREQ